MTDQGFKPVGKDFPVFLHPKTKEEFLIKERKVVSFYPAKSIKKKINEKKSSKAYKTISEAAREIGLINKNNKKPNTHTLRFWEKNFKQIRPCSDGAPVMRDVPAPAVSGDDYGRRRISGKLYARAGGDGFGLYDDWNAAEASGARHAGKFEYSENNLNPGNKFGSFREARA